MKAIPIFIFLSFVLGCQYKVDKKKFNFNPENIQTISYQMVSDNIFRPHCIRCHGGAGGISLESYEEVNNNINAILRSLDGSGAIAMPPSGPLDQDLIELLELWIERGLPEEEVPVF